MAAIFLSRLRFRGALWAVLLALFMPMAARAHPMPQSLVEVHGARDGWRLRLTLPDDRLAAAFVQAGLIRDPGPGFTAYPALRADRVRAYVASHLAARSPDGARWVVRVDDAIAPCMGGNQCARLAGRNEWQVQVSLLPPDGPGDAPVILHYAVITREIITHTAIATMVRDWQGGVLPGSPRLLGSVRGDDLDVRIDHGAGSAWQSWWGMVMLGMAHIVQGADHLAFLATLLLTVTLASVGRRWYPLEATRPIYRNTLWRISAFTLGHSVSLLATSLDWLPPAGRGVEWLIALSVAVSALHAIVPLFPRREAWVAGVFGLIHGMAFATTIRDMALSTGQIVVATLGFNLGIELVQLGLVVVILPGLLALRKKPWEARVRVPLAGAALIAALFWCVERA